MEPSVEPLAHEAPVELPPVAQKPKPKRIPVSVSLTEDLEVRYWQVPLRLPDPSDVAVFNYVEQVNRLNAQIQAGPWFGSLQLDEVALLANRYYLDDVLYVERQLVNDRVFNPFPDTVDLYLNPEKVVVRREWTLPAKTGAPGRLELTLGDSYMAFGRGIALNLNRNVDIDVDTSIQGLKTTVQSGDWDVAFVGGTANRQQVFQDNPNIGILPDLRHGIAGLQIDRYALGPAHLSAHGVVYAFTDQPGFAAPFERAARAPDALVGGLTAELTGVAGIDWFVEGDVFGYPTDKLSEGGAQPLGYALYGSATAYGPSTVWQLEFKRYADSQQLNLATTSELYTLATGPTLEYERQITEDSAAAVGSNDIWGGRARVDWAAIPGRLTPYLSLAVFSDLDQGSLHFNRSPETIVHPLAGLEYVDDNAAVFWNVGYRNDIRTQEAFGADRHAHTDVQAKIPVVSKLSADVNFAIEHFRWGRNQFQQSDYVEMESSVGLGWGSLVSLTWFTDFTQNPLINTTGNLSPRVYGAAELQFKPSPALTLKAFAGAYKAGIRCSGGQCRQLPGFEGIRGSFVASF